MYIYPIWGFAISALIPTPIFFAISEDRLDRLLLCRIYACNVLDGRWGLRGEQRMGVTGRCSLSILCLGIFLSADSLIKCDNGSRVDVLVW